MTIEELQDEMVLDLREHFTEKKYINHATREKAARKEIWRIALLTLDRLELKAEWLKGFEDIVVNRFMSVALNKMYVDKKPSKYFYNNGKIEYKETFF